MPAFGPIKAAKGSIIHKSIEFEIFKKRIAFQAFDKALPLSYISE